MRRRLFGSSSALSLFLCVATAVLWVRSYWVGDSCFLRTHSANYSCEAGNGGLWLAWHEARSADISFSHAAVRPPHDIRTAQDFAGKFGIFLDTQRSRDGGSRFSLVLPIWMMVVMTTLLALCFVAGLMRRSRRHSEGRCAACGYDLRASQNRCPECGTPIASTAKSNT